MKISELIRSFRRELDSAGIDNAALDARVLVCAVFDLQEEDLISNPEIEPTPAQETLFDHYLTRRLNREPVSRILGKREFWSLAFKVTPDTLDPRPDSEILIETVLAHLPHGKDHPYRILDLGTGTGCLLLSLLFELPNATGVGLDLNGGAVEVARQNAEGLGLDGRSKFENLSWHDFRPNQKFDWVISNPPYIPNADILELEPEVTRHDPHLALSGGDDGLDAYRDILRLMPGFLADEGRIVFEIGFHQARQVSELFGLYGFSTGRVVKDYAGQDRCLLTDCKK